VFRGVLLLLAGVTDKILESIEMIKLVMCLHRRPDITREQFQDYWLNKHGPFFQKNAAVMRSKRYVQCHTIDSQLNDAMRNSRGMQPEFDGVAEVWFESEEDLMEAMTTPEMQKLSAALLEDEASFIDHSRSSAFLVRDHEF
jgi:uncharacterized protein (TIGR02118 family)